MVARWNSTIQIIGLNLCQNPPGCKGVACWHLRAISTWLPELRLIAFAPVLFRGFGWFARSRQLIVVRRRGWTELAHALVFGMLLIAGFRFTP
jgi:hypothetical protein